MIYSRNLKNCLLSNLGAEHEEGELCEGHEDDEEHDGEGTGVRRAIFNTKIKISFDFSIDFSVEFYYWEERQVSNYIVLT